ncbi:ferrous iron transporter B [Permianibacter aggregans]|uniref:Ferrous iron transport protein B n=1 Tax=Permianibacter aggregans TaxID=1510150 RepID=A0A4R6UG40_9GAMM|nr:ferrous iron transporter B [Permianibacter aggregans]QGX41171.1 ferrous iron transporter B [Permianibacter aggregans]TDQ45770.1 ferrous iron transport protein B [Permianibacter aggregans]
MSAEQAMQVALIGNPNCGKTALFNLLTGARAKVANFPGVTVERKHGLMREGEGRIEIVDLPGTYSLRPSSLDERVAVEAISGSIPGLRAPDMLVAVIDAANLSLGLRLVVELKSMNLPMVVAMNQSDVARARGIKIDIEQLSTMLGVPVIATVAVTSHGADELIAHLKKQVACSVARPQHPALASVESVHQQVETIINKAVIDPGTIPVWQDRFDRWVMHPVLGSILLLLLLFFMFQAVFAWAEPLMDLIEGSVLAIGSWLASVMPDGLLKSLLVDGVIAGVGSVVVFLPQILILFLFILMLEDSGYLPRAAFLLDRTMRLFGLSGRAFIPLLSSFACAIPGIMATRTIQDPKERLITIMVAPLMTCSARLPVYALIIAAFVPEQTVAGLFNLQGITLFVLYLAGIVSSAIVAYFMQKHGAETMTYPLMLELPSYRIPVWRNIVYGLYDRARIFLRRVGGIILALMVVIWFLSSFPAAPENAVHPDIYYSYAGQIGRALEWVFAPIGFGWQICIALIPGMAAREVAVGALGTVYALSGEEEQVAEMLVSTIGMQWSLATAFAFLAWYVYAPQCLSTLAVVRRETNSWKQVTIMAVYLFALAYLAAFATYRLALWLG